MNLQMPIIPHPSSRRMPTITALNMTFVESLNRFWIVQKAQIPTNWAAIPTISR